MTLINACLFLTLCVTTEAAITSEQEAFFESKIRPVLMQNCFKCHGGEKVKKGLKLNSLQGLLTGGDSGPAITVKAPQTSRLIHAMTGGVDDIESMPPKKQTPKHVIADFKKWISMGAPWPNKDKDADAIETTPVPWSFIPPRRPALPKVKNTGWVKTPIDTFVLARLEAQKLTPVKQADRRTLIRRATLDLTGLPPTPAAVDAFMNDTQPEAWSRLIDRLLASPDYGVRWGRHWLDVARYADTSGDGTDMPIPEAARYRDYVIEAFNQDLPYNTFIEEQLAGDILFRQDQKIRPRERLIATSFIGLSRRFGNGLYSETPLVIDNTIETIGKAMLGMDLQCARCHDHKFDPISIEDYYAFYGFFNNTQYPHSGSERGKNRIAFVPLVDDLKTLDKRRAQSRYLVENQKKFEEAKGAKKFEENQLKKIRVLDSKITALAEGNTQDAELVKKRDDLKNELKDRKTMIRKVQEINAAFKQHELVFGVTDKTKPMTDSPVFLGGNKYKVGPLIRRGFISSITPSHPRIKENESGRLQLAQWIASSDNPLTARVMVNRIWLHHFGSGIVDTPDLFGNKGERPSHPELLDWLATSFVDQNWSIKSVHRILMRSATYQLSSYEEDVNLDTDPQNRLYWRYAPRRLSAEAIRDSMLFVSHTLDRSPAPPHPFPKDAYKTFTQHKPFTDDYNHKRRSIYLSIRRLGNHPIYTLFDGPDTNTTTGKRKTSTVPQQALFAMNSPFVRDAASGMATHVLSQSHDAATAVPLLWDLAFQRSPESEEVISAQAYLTNFAHSLPEQMAADERRLKAYTSLSRSLLVSNEFLYIK